MKKLFLILFFIFSFHLSYAKENDSWEFIFNSKKDMVVRENISALSQFLSENPGLVEEIKSKGFFRIFLSPEMKSEWPFIEEKLRKSIEPFGLSKRIDIVPISFHKNQNQETSPKTPNKEEKKSNPLTWLPRQLSFLAKSFLSSLHRPSRSHIIGGALSKLIPFTFSTVGNVANYSHTPDMMMASIGLSFALDTFHGIWVASWMRFQDRIQEKKGVIFQTIFNWAYGQFWGVWFRGFSYMAGKAKDSPFSINYLSTSFATSIVSNITGTIGTNGLNDLFKKGHITYDGNGQRQQWVRDVPFMIEQYFFSLGTEKAMMIFWSFYTVNQASSIYYRLRGTLAKERPLIFITDEKTAQSKKFQEMIGLPNCSEIFTK